MNPDPTHHIATLTPAEETMNIMTVVHLPTLTERQRATLDFIARFVAEHGYPPSVREIRDEIGVASTSTVHLDLADLETAGVIRRAGNRSRAITLTVELPAA